ncbi:hypothetical protein J5X98_27475 [Leptothermofonsia sichuanensis E412]|uniref:hypothetical protein n=1 Tax=Leptothermofonsia sichuanensis TaxID=2917832 RepID=UPI001CA6F2B7|nr:hypothetical protein [Leptothermofonsia sichuanensis]QZZ20893.1 hypothetical protein J5X98_27475 [Leptothermofonsia sichuanensis E412]
MDFGFVTLDCEIVETLRCKAFNQVSTPSPGSVGITFRCGLASCPLIGVADCGYVLNHLPPYLIHCAYA